MKFILGMQVCSNTQNLIHVMYINKIKGKHM